MKVEMRLTGSGGQGMITAGIILGRAASIYDNYNAVQSQSYGPEARGGASKAEVIISDQPINYPKVVAIDILVALTQEAADKYCNGIKDGAIVIVDSLTVKNPPKGNFKIFSLPIIITAAEKVGKLMTANIVTVGVISRVFKLVSDDAMISAIKSMIPKGTEELNINAFNMGKEIMDQYCKDNNIAI